MFLNPPPESEAVERLFQQDLKDWGFVMNLSRLWAWRPEVYEAFVGARTALTVSSTLSKRDLGVMVCATAAQLGDAYCALAWGGRLAHAASPAVAAAVIADDAPGDAPLTARDRALAAWARQLVADPNATTADSVDALRAAGLSEREIFEATVYIALRLAFSTVNDALGASPDREVAEAAPPEVRAAVRFGRPAADAPSAAG